MHELKYIIRETSLHGLTAWLRGRCAPDPEHPEGRIRTVYYDTPELDLLLEKANSDYLKTKVRLRWYRRSGRSSPDACAFLEIKRKVGAHRAKERWRSPVGPIRLESEPLCSGIFADALLPAREAGVILPHGLTPLLEVTYARSRLVDPISGARIAIDRSTCTSRVNRRRLTMLHPAPAHVAVVEVKGDFVQTPAIVDAIRRFGARRESYSKYLHGYRRAIGAVLN